MLGSSKGLCPGHWGSRTCPCMHTHPPLQSLWKESNGRTSSGVVRLSEFTGFILMHFNRQTVPRDLAQASLPNLQQIAIIPARALWVKTSFLWFLIVSREPGCHPWFTVTARRHCGFVNICLTRDLWPNAASPITLRLVCFSCSFSWVERARRNDSLIPGPSWWNFHLGIASICKVILVGARGLR